MRARLLAPDLLPRRRPVRAASHVQAVRRRYASLGAPRRSEHIAIAARSNGAISIDIFHSPAPASPVLVYLPSGPVIPDCTEDVISTLAATSGATIARINYRASPVHQFPTPIHDVLLGYDWVRENLLQDASSRPVLARMGVCGELMGASLAAMLALTECRLGEPRIGAAAINNPIVDWVFPDDLPLVPASELPEPRAPEETAFPADEDLMAIGPPPGIGGPPVSRKTSKRAPKPPPPTSWQRNGDNSIIPTLLLSGERDVLFRKSEDFFDRFASPIHFFRSPHGTLLYPHIDDSLASKRPEDLLDIETQMDLSHYQSIDQGPATLEPPTLVRCRAYARVYPAAGTNLSLPVWHLGTGLQSPLFDQTSELTKMLRRSIARHTLKTRTGRTRWHDSNEKENFEKYTNERVQLDTSEGIGLWTQQEPESDWRSRVEKVGTWMKEKLEPGFK